MTREDICNVEPVSPREVLAAVEAMRISDQVDDAKTEARWALTEGGE